MIVTQSGGGLITPPRTDPFLLSVFMIPVFIGFYCHLDA